MRVTFEAAFQALPPSLHRHCTDEAQKAETVLSAVIYIYIYIYRRVDICRTIYILSTVSLFRISIATLKMNHCDYDRFLNGNLIKSLDSYTFSSLSSLELV